MRSSLLVCDYFSLIRWFFPVTPSPCVPLVEVIIRPVKFRSLVRWKFNLVRAQTRRTRTSYHITQTSSRTTNIFHKGTSLVHFTTAQAHWKGGFNRLLRKDYLHSIFDATKQKGFGIPSIYWDMNTTVCLDIIGIASVTGIRDEWRSLNWIWGVYIIV